MRAGSGQRSSRPQYGHKHDDDPTGVVTTTSTGRQVRGGLHDEPTPTGRPRRCSTVIGRAYRLSEVTNGQGHRAHRPPQTCARADRGRFVCRRTHTGCSLSDGAGTRPSPLPDCPADFKVTSLEPPKSFRVGYHAAALRRVNGRRIAPMAAVGDCQNRCGRHRAPDASGAGHGSRRDGRQRLTVNIGRACFRSCGSQNRVSNCHRIPS